MVNRRNSPRSFSHPITRIALNQDHTAMSYRRIIRAVRLSLDESLAPDERIKHARQALRLTPDLELMDDSAQEFLLEWSTCVSSELEHLVLLDACALARLHRHQVTLSPLSWNRLTLAPQDPPLLKRTDGRVYDSMFADTPYDTWLIVIRLAREAVVDGREARWDVEECSAALRALAICGCAGRIEPGRQDAPAALHFMEGEGTYVWGAIANRLGQLDGHVLSQEWLLRMRQRVLAHLAGLVQTKAEKAPVSTLLAGDEALGTQATSAGPGELIVITAPIPEAADKCDRDLIRQYEALREPVPVAKVPTPLQINELLSTLGSEFPWAPDVIERLEEMLILPSRLGVQQLTLRPVLLVGPPGSGKSRLCRRLAELLGWPYEAIACGGSGDIKQLSGTARGWATGEPMPLLRTMLARRTASVLCLLDEVDKAAATSSKSPPLMSMLLGLLEPETASRYRDGYLQVPCNLSRVAFWATANGISTVPAALRSRFDIIAVPVPSAEHMPQLIRSITAELEREWNLPPGMLPVVPDDLFAGRSVSPRVAKRIVYQWIKQWSDVTLAPHRLH